VTRERILVAVGSALFLYLVFFRGATPIFPFTAGSHGVFFDEADRVRGGEVMYRDFFEFLAPGTVYLTALVQWLLGPNMAAMGIAMVALGSLLAALIHVLSSMVSSGRWRLLPPAAFVALVYAPGPLGDHKWPALASGLLGLIILGRGSLAPARAWFGGLFLGGAAAFTQDLALGLSLGALVHLARQRTSPRLLLAAAAGIAVIPLLVLGLFAWKAGLGTVLYDWLVYPLQRYPGMNVGLVNRRVVSLRALPRDVAQVAMAAIGVAGGLVALLRKRGPGVVEAPADRVVRLVASAGLGMAAIMAHRALFPAGLAVQACALLPVMAWTLSPREHPGRLASRWIRPVVAAVLAIGLAHALAFVVWRQLFQRLTLEEHRAGRVWVTTPMPELTWIERNTRPHEETFLFPARGGQYFLSRTRNATSLPYLIEGQNTPEQARRALLEIEAARPEVGLWDARPWPALPAGETGPLALLYEGITRSYHVERLPNGVALLRRRHEAREASTPGEGAPR
jgi:hypothetical protein